MIPIPLLFFPLPPLLSSVSSHAEDFLVQKTRKVSIYDEMQQVGFYSSTHQFFPLIFHPLFTPLGLRACQEAEARHRGISFFAYFSCVAILFIFCIIYFFLSINQPFLSPSLTLSNPISGKRPSVGSEKKQKRRKRRQQRRKRRLAWRKHGRNEKSTSEVSQLS